MRAIIGTLFFTCVVIFNSIQLSSQSSSPPCLDPNAKKNDEDFSAESLSTSTGHSGGVYHETPNIREGHIGMPRSLSFQRRLEAYQQELARGGKSVPAPYSPRRPPRQMRPNEELYSVPPAADGVYHNMQNRQVEFIENYLEPKHKSDSQVSETKSGSGSESGSRSGSGSGSGSKGISWSKSKNKQ